MARLVVERVMRLIEIFEYAFEVFFGQADTAIFDGKHDVVLVDPSLCLNLSVVWRV